MEFKPVKKTNLCDYVIDQLKSLIVKGELKVGDKLPNERELSDSFDVGRSSVREALKVLTLQGLLERTNSGTYVAANFSKIIEETLTIQILMNNASYREIVETRLMLELQLIGLATERCTDEDLNKIKEQIDEMETSIEKNDKDRFVDSDIMFHQYIANAAYNSVLLYLYNTITDLIFKVQKQVAYDDYVFKVSFDYHQKIYEAMKTREKQKAIEMMEQHLLDVQNRLEDMNDVQKITERSYGY